MPGPVLSTSYVLFYFILITPCEMSIFNFMLKDLRLREVIPPMYNCTILYRYS